MCIDIKNMYLATPLDRAEYMRIHKNLIPSKFQQAYNLHTKYKGDFLYIKIIRGMYGLPQAGILANKLLKEHLKPFRYYEVEHTPGIWRHQTLPLFFTLVVDNFGIQYVDSAHAQRLINALQQQYELSID